MNLEELREYCLSLPAATENIKWEHDLCFSIGGKMFCVASLEQPFSFSFKATDADFTRLTELPFLIPAPYLARYKWVLAQTGHLLNRQEVETLILTSYALIKAKLTKKQLKEANLV